MLEVREDFHLSLEEGFELIVSDEFVPSDHFDGDWLRGIFAVPLVDLAELPLAHHFSQSVAMVPARDGC